ncbi:GNAT family N-acetyltransferase [Dactylosporangium matsuzakiense]|uniref:N-acetyltransferase n=1 Tax=Dactylosporangium matsuzakiense TaxID=53360 RepID=A0A9W6NTV6_9ACTN|nr:GNAT family N-acetyltransferase [Dactylosporangium matsuzakiense]UWZ48654.1 GNAT family N-acetyltransferase [Dactylosporangium matsuzakiense]GLL08637.1 N-acetyltransferase [Dactylosporangium matsuzakiense]
MRVRPATVEDAAAIATVHVRTWQLTYRNQIPQVYLEQLDVTTRREQWQRRLRTRPAAVVLVLEHETAGVVGFVAAEAGEVQAIYILPAFQGRGGGRRLMSAALDALRAGGDEGATLWVLATNEPARRFYEAGGWHPDGTTRTEDFGGEPVEELRYRRRSTIAE